MTTTPKTEAASSRTFAKYTGLAGLVSERIISTQDFDAVGIPGQPTLNFNVGNRFMLDVTDSDPRVLEILRTDPDFSLTTADNPRPPTVIETNSSSASAGEAPGAGLSATTGTGTTRSASTSGGTGS